MSHIGNNIARLRGFRQIPQKEMASKLQIAQQTYSILETKSEIDEEMLERIAIVLDFPIQAIKELDSHSVLSVNQQGGNAGSIFYQYNPNEKMIELYERMIKERDENIETLKSIIEKIKSA